MSPTTQSDVRRRIWVAVTLVIGAVTLALTLRLEPGDDLFLVAGFALAAVWGGGALLAGPLPSGGMLTARALWIGAGIGALLLVSCLLVALFVATVPVLREPAEELLAHADGGALVPVVLLTFVNGIGEEMFFRGSLYDAVPRRAALTVTTVVYTLTTIGSGVVLLVLAAAMLGAVTALLRERTGGLVAPAATHLVWSIGMLLLLPTALATGR